MINVRQGTLQFDDSQCRGANAANIATFLEANNKQTPELLKEIRRMENGFTEKLENLNQRVDRMNRLARHSFMHAAHRKQREARSSESAYVLRPKSPGFYPSRWSRNLYPS